MKNTYFYRGKLCTLETECSAILRVRVCDLWQVEARTLLLREPSGGSW
jgi:hypothetical protein